ncbi:hypothetical protein Cgig2_029659 [Carnegiea gigantea]|uniref:VWFA domain-containing protein n=1 Tax=Carnegiea gigantea TaxID=171969 RepID=A0A9Q1KJ21_9CARY|nr:hypothetical protein Cgig2_029659 [Carnegiea gigantea]
MRSYDDDEEPVYEANLQSLGSDGVIHGEKVDMTVICNRKTVLTCEIDMDVKVELMGSLKLSEDDRRVGVDMVAILNISAAAISIDEWQYLQETMWFLVTQLSPVDRLSVVVFTTNAKRLCPLRLMSNEGAKMGILRMMNIYLALNYDGRGNIAACLRKALQVLKERSYSEGRKQAIILVSDRDATNDAARVPVGDVPVHAFAFGRHFANHAPLKHDGVVFVLDVNYECGANTQVLKQIANKSNGGSFSVLDPEDTKYTCNLRRAFSQCFAQLFPVVVPNLKLNFTTPGEIISVTETVGGIAYLFTESNVAGALTLSLVNLYGQERRTFDVKLLLPEYQGELIDNKVEVDVLQITYSYSDCEESYDEYISPPAVVSVTRSTNAWHALSPYVMTTDHYIKLGNAVQNYNDTQAEIQPINTKKKDDKDKKDKKKPRYTDDEEPIYKADLESFGTNDQVFHAEKLYMRIINDKKWAPTCESNLNVKAELMGSARLLREDNSRQHGVDIVVILDVRANMEVQIWQDLQEVMCFLVGQLSPIDRLSVVIDSPHNADRLCRLRLMNEGAKRDVLKLVNIHLAIGSGSEGNIAACLSKALEVINGRRFSEGLHDLKLTFTTPEEIKSITEIVAGRRYIHTNSNVTGSITLSLGNLYSQERREFCIELGLPECDHEDELIDDKADAKVLQISYSHSDGAKMYDAPPATVYL